VFLPAEIFDMKKTILPLLLTVAISCSHKLSPDHSWTNQRWVLIEMKGVPVQLSGGSRDAYISFFPENNSFTGNGGCNRVNGNYSINKSSIHFTEVASTKMSCSDIGFEQAFLSTLDRVNRFEQRDNRIHLKRDKEVVLILEAR
jgi:heat shock protein HslJ